MLIIVVALIFTDIALEREKAQIILEKDNQIKVLAARTTLMLDNAGAILEATSKLPQVRAVPDARLISGTFHGIPEDVDKEKRYVARSVLDSYKGFEFIFFLLPNGDMYMLEPFSAQPTLTTDNFAFRDYYKGAARTHSTYLSEVYVSAATGHKAAAIATPVYSQDNLSLSGMWVGALDLQMIDDFLKTVQGGKNSRFVYVDQNGQKIADSGMQSTEESFEKLDIFKKTLAGEAGSTVEVIDGTKMFVSYSPIRTLSNTWIVLFMQPYDDAFYTVNLIQNEAYGITTLIVAILSISSFLIVRVVRANTRFEELREIDRLKDEFGSMVTHELKTPFVPIRGHIDMLKEPDLIGKLNPDQLESLNVIIKNITRLEELITDLLDTQKLEMNLMIYKKEDFKVGDVVEQVIRKYTDSAKEKNVELVNSCKENYPIKTDREKIERVLSNLVKNSIEFSQEKNARVEIGAQSDRKSVVFYVKDNGIGIPKEKQQNLFRKFYQVDTSHTRKHGGVGLGLVVCKGVVEGLGGNIWFESEEGKGTTFYFRIPEDQN